MTFKLFQIPRLLIQQVRIHDSFSHVRWGGALMEVRSLFGLYSAVQKNTLRTDRGRDGRTDGWTDGWTDRWTDGRTDGQTEVQTYGGQMDGQMD